MLLEREPLLAAAAQPSCREPKRKRPHSPGQWWSRYWKDGSGRDVLRGGSREARVLWGSCDPVVPARPFAPVVDIVAEGNGPLRAALEVANRDGVFEAFLALMREPLGAAQVVVFEDLHWADDATLDLLRVVGRRMRDLSVLFIGTFRDDEVGKEHPLRLALGDIPSGVEVVLDVPALSIDAVEVLAEGSREDAVALHRLTAGNPFFVTEVLAAGQIEMPATVRDAVSARANRLSPAAQRTLRAASVLGQVFEPAILQDVAETDRAAIEECVARGMLQRDGELLRFRHELAQWAVREASDPSDMPALNGRALAALRQSGAATPTVERIR